MRLFLFVTISTLFIAGSNAANAQIAPNDNNGRIALGVYLGTPGVGADLQIKAHDVIALRAGGHFLDFGIERDIDDINYDADLRFSNAYASIDLHPWQNGWMLSAGAILGSKRLDLTGQPTTPVEIGDVVFSPAEVGTVLGDVRLNDVAPFVGLGFDNALTSSSRWGFSVLAGVAFTGEPDVELTAVGGILEDTPQLLAELEEEEMRIQDDVRAFRYYPVVRIGVTRRF